MSLVLTPLKGIPNIQPGDDLAGMIVAALEETALILQDGDILVLAQKIVSKAEGRLVNLAEIIPSAEAIELADQAVKDPRLVEVILRESGEVVRVRQGTIITEHRLGFVCASAGVDHSNASYDPQLAGRQDPFLSAIPPRRNGEDEWVLLLPEDSDATAQKIREQMEVITGLHIAVMIIDSHGRAWRLGTVGVAIGLAGLPGLVDLRGETDLFGYQLKITVVGAADELAAAASLVMGQAAEGTPIVHVRGFPYPLREGSLKEIIRPRELDMFR